MAVLKDSYNTGDDELFGIIDTTYRKGQTFTASSNYDITSVKLLMYKQPGSSPGTVTVNIKAITGEGDTSKPTGEDLVVGTIEGNDLTEDTDGEWIQITFGDVSSLVSGTQYGICVGCAGTNPNVIYLRRKIAGGYAGGHTCKSSDGGDSWSATTDGDVMFEVWGTETADEYEEGTKTVTSIAFVSLSVQTYASKKGPTPDRPTSYDPSGWWDETTGMWSGTYVGIPGSWIQHVLVISEEGDIYFRTV